MSAPIRAWRFTDRGDPADVLSLTDTTMSFSPDARDEECIIVKTAFVGLNVNSIFQMTLIPQFLRAKTCTAEVEFSGEVLGTANPYRFKLFDKVMAIVPASHALKTGTGALSEHILIPAKYAVHKPGNVSYANAAGCLLTGVTAKRLVFESRVRTSGRVLVNAASGGVGTMVMQMARYVVGKNGYVVAICSGKNVALVKELGADEVSHGFCMTFGCNADRTEKVVDYTKTDDLPSYLADVYADKPFTAIIDTLGHQSLYLASPKYLVQGGVYASVGVRPPDFSVQHSLRAALQKKLNEWWPVSPWLGGVGRLWKTVSMMEPTLRELDDISLMMQRRHIKLVKDSVWEFEEVKDAYAKLASTHASGKVLVRVDPDINENTY